MAVAARITEAAPGAQLVAVVFEQSSEHGRRLLELLEQCCGPVAAAPDPDFPDLRLAVLPLASVTAAVHGPMGLPMALPSGLAMAPQRTLGERLQQSRGGLTALLATRSGIATTQLALDGLSPPQRPAKRNWLEWLENA